MSTTSINILIDGNQETDVLPRTSELSAPLLENKYLYPEFAGFAGERLLKSILRKVLPMALYRTWEILTERQAPGNDVFLSVSRLCEEAERGERTIQLNLQELQARCLLLMRLERKLFMQPDGTLRPRLVVIKDFTALYALASEYLEWMRSDDYIEPRREIFRYLLLEDLDEGLRKKLLRFDNYRRLLLNKLPGPKIIERESHRWYTEYHSSSPENSGHIDAQRAYEQKKYQDPNLYLQKDLQENLQKDSQERKRTSDYSDKPERDSFESDAPLGGEGGGRDYTKRPKVSRAPQTREGEIANALTNPTNTNVPSFTAGETGRAAGAREQADLDPRAATFVQRALQVAQAGQGRSQTQPAGSIVLPNPLVSAFVREIAPLFHDRNKKGSLTRALRSVASASLAQKDVLACLVTAYQATCKTATVHKQHRHPEGDNKMPLFCTLFERFVKQCLAGNFRYDDAELAEKIASDDRLVQLVIEQKLETMVLESQESAEAQQSWIEEEDAAEEEVPSIEAELEPSEAQESLLEEIPLEKTFQEALSTPVLTVEHPDDGFRTWEDANKYGEWLREESGEPEYGHQVWITQYGCWVILLYQQEDLAATEIFLNREMVRVRLAELRKTKREKQRESLAPRSIGRAKRR